MYKPTKIILIIISLITLVGASLFGINLNQTGETLEKQHYEVSFYFEMFGGAGFSMWTADVQVPVVHRT
jgi:hypothetical protein